MENRMASNSCKNNIKRIPEHAIFLFEIFFRKEWKDLIDEGA